eukprot:3429058-Ditylum_brightwellii.AAC.1
MVQFGMKNTLVSFQDKYFVYKGAAKGAHLTNEDIALAIGGYKSAFLVVLVALYLFEKTGSKFIEANTKTYTEMMLKDFQSRVNELTGGDYLQFTTKILKPTTEVKLTV